MIKIATLTNENIARNCLLSPGKLKKNYVLGQLLDQGRIALHVHKDILTSGAMPKDELRLTNAQMKKLESKRNMKKKLR